MSIPSLSTGCSSRLSFSGTSKHSAASANVPEPENVKPDPSLPADQTDFRAPSNTEAQSNPAPPAQNFFQSLSDRISRFFKDLGKAFTRLFNPEKPKSALDAQLKNLKRNLKQAFNEKALEQDFQDFAKKMEETSPGSEEHQAFAPLVAAAKSEATRKQWIDESTLREGYPC
jgi:hypothetical protein